MKTKKITLVLFAAFITLNVFAAPVSVEKAQQVGQSFLAKPVTATGVLKANRERPDLKLVYTAAAVQIGLGNQLLQNSEQTFVPFFIFGTENQGFVIVAGDDRAIPILGYSDDGNFDPNNIPPNMQKWLEGYKAEIRYAIENNIVASARTQAEWQSLQSGGCMNAPSSLAAAVAPLLTTKWDQLPYYNDLCPGSGSNKAVTGCVATAMAQVMKFWNAPTTGTGFHSYNSSNYGTLTANFGSTNYNWTSMPNQLTASSSAAQKTAVATLMYHCGVSVEMNYSAQSSGAYVASAASPITHCTEYALKTYFGYKSTLKGVLKSNYTDANWINLLKIELDAHRPIVYVGSGNGGGHCFVCDGYDNNNYFHFNWGWSGHCDGYYAMNALNPTEPGTGGGSGTYNTNQHAVIGIEPGSGGGGGGTTPTTNDLRLNSGLNMASTQIWFGSNFSVSASVKNFGTNTFSGLLGAAVFNNQGYFVDFLQTGSVTLQSGASGTYTFNKTGSMLLVPGTYYVAIFYTSSPSAQDWTIVGDGSYSNVKQFQIIYSANIEVYSDFTISGGKLIQGQTASVSVYVANAGSTTFYGDVHVNLAKLDGTWVQDIQILSVNGLLSNNIGYGTFVGTITAPPGTYLMELGYRNQGTSQWYYAGSTYYQNPVYVIVEAQPIPPDIYETNDTQAQAYTLPVSFSSNNARVKTNGSNLHNSTDIDFYKIVLPAGYKYTITPRLQDQNSSNDGQQYTVDAIFSYSTNGTTYSDVYDDVMTGNIVVNNGGTVYFQVAPYFAGNVGTYLLDISISRTSSTGIDDVELNNQISIYPNPVKDELRIMNYELRIMNVEILDITGKIIYNSSFIFNNFINVSSLPQGNYFLKIQTDKGIITKKFIKE